ncbi:glycine betaine/L-proline ABC transporter ATP-binding protein [Arthrobacter sp. NPDC056727]|uniref:quaternary amine ABC transporter ATP-binding protein n=1 Tax=Arthrobacter sp. NPDC056727 TaxID=3345927 RepID=UPI00366D4320
MSAPSAIEVRNLTKIYELPKLQRTWRQQLDPVRKPAVDSVSFSIKKGELFVIMGLSGSGKSTLLRMLNRLVEPTSGETVIAGLSINGLKQKDLRTTRNETINMVFQHFAIFPHRTVLENAAYGLQVRGMERAEREARAMEALKTVGLEEWAHELPGALSGGMRQRVGLARGLATDAEILLMDEPFSALDPLIRRDMQDLLLKLQDKLQKTIVFVTHDLNEAMRLGDRIMVMRDGKVIQLGTAGEILARPADPYVAKFVSDVDRSRVVTAQEVMREPLLTAARDESAGDVLARLANAEAHGIYVLDQRGCVIGAVSAEALSRGVQEGAQSLAQIPTAEYSTVDSLTLLSELFPLVGRNCVPLGITDPSGRLVGVLSVAALLAALSDTERRFENA